jgi:hypothetical protein
MEVNMPDKYMPQSDIRLREAIAVYLYGKAYTTEQLKGVGILGSGRWIVFPKTGDYRRIGNIIQVRQDGEGWMAFK